MEAQAPPTDDLVADCEVLEFAAAHDFVLAGQIRSVVDEVRAASTARVERLVSDGLMEPALRLRADQLAYRITRLALRRQESELPPPRTALRDYWEQVQYGWLWVAARRERFGPVDAIYSRRAMKAADAEATSIANSGEFSPAIRAKLADTRFAAQIGDQGHYPGVTLVVPHGRIAMEVFLSRPSRRHLGDVLDAYAAKPQITVLVIMALAREWGDEIRQEVDRHGMTDRVRLQRAQVAAW